MVDFGQGPSRRSSRPEVPASYSEIAAKAPDLSNRGLLLPYTEDGSYSFERPTFSTRGAVTLGDSENFRATGPKEIVMKLHAIWGHASAQQLKRGFGGLVFEQCEGCRPFNKAPQAPVAGTSTAAMLNEKLQVDLLFRTSFPSTPCGYSSGRNAPGRFGMPFAARGLGLSAL